MNWKSPSKWWSRLVRPTGLVDPEVVVKPAKNQVDDLVRELTRVVQHGKEH